MLTAPDPTMNFAGDGKFKYDKGTESYKYEWCNSKKI